MILVTGGTGQLATAMARLGGDAVHVAGRPQFDLDAPDSIASTFHAVRPSLVVNAAAWTAVDAAEDQPEAAMRANRDGPACLAALCERAGIPLIHVSTDYVFDGAKGAPYVETDATNPTGVYGATKLAGEAAVLAACSRTIILRTSWVYSAFGKNFVKTMLRVAATQDRLRVVADQKGCPTAAPDLAQTILAMADRLQGGWDRSFAGVFHAAGTGWTTWHGLAEATFAAAAAHGFRKPVVEAIATADYPTPAHRPADSRLDCGKLAAVFGLQQPEWQKSLPGVVEMLVT